MKIIIRILALAFVLPAGARADVWMWEDALGKVHYVETNRTIYTWVESDRVFYSDAPDHEDAVAVVLVWHSKGSLEDLRDGGPEEEVSGETASEKASRQAAEAHYCKRATEIYDSYLGAPKLYRSTKKGEREFLSEKEAKAKIAETKAELDKYCK